MSHVTQEVVSHGGQDHHQGIGGEFSRGQALEIQIRLELAVVLPGSAALLVEGDHGCRIGRFGIQAGTPAIQRQLREQPGLAVTILGPFDQADHPASAIGFLLESSFDDFIEYGHSFAGSNLHKALPGFRTGFPGFGIFTPGIPFDQVVHLFTHQLFPIGGGVMRAVQGDQQFAFPRQQACPGQGSVGKKRENPFGCVDSLDATPCPRTSPPHPDRRRGGHAPDAQGPLENRILAHALDRLEVILSLTEQAHIGVDQVNPAWDVYIFVSFCLMMKVMAGSHYG